MRHLPLLLAVAVVGCGPEPPGSKLNSDPATNATPNNTANNTANNTPNNTTTVDPTTWATDGPATDTAKSQGGFARCTLEDVDTADLGESNVADVPPDPWPSSVVPVSGARCGDDLETLVWRLHNCERIGVGEPPMQCDERLVWLAREHTLDMIRWDYFRHDNPQGELVQDRAERHGIPWSEAGENLAMSATVLDLHYAWMDSTIGHRENILGDYSHVGVGIEPHPSGGLIATTVFLVPP